MSLSFNSTGYAAQPWNCEERNNTQPFEMLLRVISPHLVSHLFYCLFDRLSWPIVLCVCTYEFLNGLISIRIWFLYDSFSFVACLIDGFFISQNFAHQPSILTLININMNESEQFECIYIIYKSFADTMWNRMQHQLTSSNLF